MVRSIFISFALLGLLMQPLCELWIVSQYQAKKDFIVKNLCEKRGLTQNTCQGRCYLKKQLSKSKEAERKAQFDTRSLLEKEYPPHRYSFSFASVFSDIESPLYFRYLIRSYVAKVSPAFHPPPYSA